MHPYKASFLAFAISMHSVFKPVNRAMWVKEYSPRYTHYGKDVYCMHMLCKLVATNLMMEI